MEKKSKISREITSRDVSCLENLVVAYNTVFLISSLFLVSIAGTAENLFSDYNRTLSPSVTLFIIGIFIIVLAGVGYVGVAKRSSSLMNLYTMLLIFIFVMEISAGLGILSFKRDIKLMASSKMKKAIAAYPEEPLTANLVDYIQLELKCCGANSYRDWDDIFDASYHTFCKTPYTNLPQSCCTKSNDTITVNTRGCLPAIIFMLKRSTLLLTSGIITICCIQILGAYFSYALSSTLNKYKIQEAKRYRNIQSHQTVEIPPDFKEKSNYF